MLKMHFLSAVLLESFPLKCIFSTVLLDKSLMLYIAKNEPFVKLISQKVCPNGTTALTLGFIREFYHVLLHKSHYGVKRHKILCYFPQLQKTGENLIVPL